MRIKFISLVFLIGHTKGINTNFIVASTRHKNNYKSILLDYETRRLLVPKTQRTKAPLIYNAF